MPIKLPKGFARRKSVGNALDETENPPRSSFRVFERTRSDSRLLTTSEPPPEDPDNIFAGTERPVPPKRSSGGTERSAATSRLYESSSSTRFSSSSTLPSSADGTTHDDVSSSLNTRNFHDVPVPPLASVLRAAGRTFSFGGKGAKLPATPPGRAPPLPDHVARESPASRATTASTGGTATPPRLQDSDFHLETTKGGLGNTFDNIGKPKSAIFRGLSPARSVDDKGPETAQSTTNAGRPDPASRLALIDTDRSRAVEPSPNSWDSRTSEDRLLSPGQPPAPQKPLPNSASMPFGVARERMQSSASMPLLTTSHRSLERPVSNSDKGLRRSSILRTDTHDTSPLEMDEDAKLVMQSYYGNQWLDKDTEENAPLFASGESERSRTERLEEPLDSSLATHAALAAKFEGMTSEASTKVMTPSQFERYRQQQELRRSNSDASKSDESVNSDDDEDEDAHQNREAEKQRRRQEAHLAVYRQQMMKVTGQQAPGPSLRPGTNRGSSSTPNLLSHVTVPGDAAKTNSKNNSEEEEDDDIPLGILAAHGFPSRNRPPTRLGSASSNPNLRASVQPYIASPGSTVGDHRASLPVFARNLPRDPYFGAGLVTPANRESLAFGGGAASVYGGPAAAPTLPPGGLVGVIATEERARAMRRGSPNAQAGFEARGGFGAGVNPYTMMNMPTPGMPPPPAAMSPSEQAQLQLSQQMNQMMQMQMQWMQQMMQMQGGAPGSSPAQSMPTLAPPMALNPAMRPLSVAGFDSMLAGPPQVDPRTLSMLDPSMSGRWSSQALPLTPSNPNRVATPGAPGYAPSIAPSERSNVGMASRYRPVSTSQPDQKENLRPPSVVSSARKPWANEYRQSTLTLAPPQGPPQLPKSNSMTTATVRAVAEKGNRQGGGSANSDDENDDAAWAEMMQKREKKKSGWKLRRATSSLGDLLSVVH